MVDINDAGRIQEAFPAPYKAVKKFQVFKMVVGQALAVLIYRAAQDGK